MNLSLWKRTGDVVMVLHKISEVYTKSLHSDFIDSSTADIAPFAAAGSDVEKARTMSSSRSSFFILKEGRVPRSSSTSFPFFKPKSSNSLCSGFESPLFQKLPSWYGVKITFIRLRRCVVVQVDQILANDLRSLYAQFGDNVTKQRCKYPQDIFVTDGQLTLLQLIPVGSYLIQRIFPESVVQDIEKCI